MTAGAGRIEVRARWASAAVLERAAARPRGGTVAARGESAIHVDLDGFVVAVLGPAGPRLPNAVAVGAGLAGDRVAAPGEPALLEHGRLLAGRLAIEWDPERPPRWDPAVPRWPAGSVGALGERARAILAGLGTEVGSPPRQAGEPTPIAPVPGEDAAVALAALTAIRGLGSGAGAREGLATLLAAVGDGDPDLARRAARLLAGRGDGLTPAGDDILAATALTVVAAGAAIRGGAAPDRRWTAALAPADLRRRTSAFSATLLELATRGQAIGLAAPLLDPRTDGSQLGAALKRIAGLGHSTGEAYAATIGAVAIVLAAARRRSRQAAAGPARRGLDPNRRPAFGCRHRSQPETAIKEELR